MAIKNVKKETLKADLNSINNNSNSDVEARVIQPNSFINGDCMEFMRTCPPNFFDLAIVDPPYDIPRFKTNVESKMMSGFKNKICSWDFKPAPEYFEQLFRISKNQIVWGGNYFTDMLPVSRGWIYWNKKKYVPNFSAGELAWTSFDTVLKEAEIQMHGFLNPDGAKQHPTQKPVVLYKWILREYAKAGDLILDTHVGSASSLIACTELGYDYVGFEIDKEYYEMAKSRLGRATRKYELFEAV